MLVEVRDPRGAERDGEPDRVETDGMRTTLAADDEYLGATRDLERHDRPIADGQRGHVVADRHDLHDAVMAERVWAFEGKATTEHRDVEIAGRDRDRPYERGIGSGEHRSSTSSHRTVAVPSSMSRCTPSPPSNRRPTDQTRPSGVYGRGTPHDLQIVTDSGVVPQAACTIRIGVLVSEP
jgi:hypothetical protein